MAAAEALHSDPQQLALYGPVRVVGPRPAKRVKTRIERPLCAACRASEARYGFRSEDDPTADRPRTLCFECFRSEVLRRQAAAERARGPRQVTLPLQNTLDELSRRRRRAQIAARHALESR
jgi:hypothetical protein